MYEIWQVNRMDKMFDDEVLECGTPHNKKVAVTDDYWECTSIIKKLISLELNRIVMIEDHGFYDYCNIDFGRCMKLLTGPMDESNWYYRELVWFDVVDSKTGEVIRKGGE